MTLTDLENNAIGILGSMPDRTPQLVRMTLKQLLPLYPALASNVSDHDIEEAARRIESKMFIRMQDASTIQVPFQEWLPQRRGEVPGYFYPRYRRYLASRGFPPAVLGVLDKDTDKVVGLLQDPRRQGAWKRRGLVVGHVQSGKTANYTGVICKAADYGYRFIVVLTGIQEDLRVQTQERIEEGFIGVSTEATAPRDSQVGVGLLGLEHRPWSLTSRACDFQAAQVNLAVSLQSLGEPLVLVMKKNARILANLVSWIRTKSHEGGGRIAGVPMLLIDDEADNASVNVAADGRGPTTINARIRELLDMFDRNVYVGYTATPFANIFIDPESTDEWQREDLFPRDFIVSLDAPTNYVGAARIFSDDGDLHHTLVEVTDHAATLPERHKISHDVRALPDSLVEAVRVFVLSRALKILRGKGASHSSMLVNVSRFNDVQTRITGLVNDHLNAIRLACQGHAMLPEEEALRDPQMRGLRAAWDSQYGGRVSETWRDVQPVLSAAAGPIDVRKINSRSPDSLDYRRYRDTGLHVIAVGGFALSRGFTLEGLTVSYFLRNSLMYDTLLQMGRWFGYRDGYDDICRIYMTPTAIDWYSHISEAIDELREEFKRMERARRTPREFGLKVRAHPDSLIVTARNKMRTGRKVSHSVALGGSLIETTALRLDAVARNRKSLASFLEVLDRTSIADAQERAGFMWRGVPAALVRDFIAVFRNHDDASIKTQSGPVCSYIEAHEADTLGEWDVCLFSPTRTDAGSARLAGREVNLQQRAATFSPEEGGGEGYITISGRSMRVAGRGQERAGMSPKEQREAEDEFRRLPGNADRNVPDWAYRQRRVRPLLMLHLLQVEIPQGPRPRTELGEWVAAWGASFPGTGERETEVEYVVNTTWWAENFGADIEELEQEADEAA